MQSEHAELLNHLVDMQASPAYAVRKQVLVQAERTIVEQETRILQLENQVKRMTKCDWS